MTHVEELIAEARTNGYTEIDLSNTDVTDLSPLKGMPLEGLYLDFTKVTDLTTLEGMPLKVLYLSGTKVTDLTPLEGMPLEGLHLLGTPAADEPLPEWLNNVRVYL